MRNIYCQLIAMFFLGVASQWSLASQLTNVTTDVKTVVGDTVDILIPATPNAGLISYSKFSNFSVDRPLKILNTVDAHGLNGITAKLIIIQSDNVDIRNQVEIVGETADVLLVSANSNNPMRCLQCGFSNIGRLTFAVGSTTFATYNQPTNLAPMQNSLIQVTSLSAPGVASVEFIASKINLSGQIDTQLKASLLSDGSYQINPTGGAIVGSGGINVFAGFNVDYRTLTLSPLSSSSTIVDLQLSANVTSQAIRINSSSSFAVTGTLSTKSDAQSIMNYRNHVSATKESISLFALGKLNADIIVNGQLSSDNLIDIEAGRNLYLNSNIKTKELKVIAANSFAQRGISEFDTATVTADSIDNNGKFVGNFMQAAAINTLQNRFGGQILADVIELSSVNGVVRNGSLYPFRPKNELPSVLVPQEPTSVQLGTVASINGMPYQDATKESNLSAYIIGKDITISAPSNDVQNINSYFVATPDSRNWANGIPFISSSVEQVRLIAENNLKINSGRYVLNSSAVMGVNNRDGEFTINSPYVTNERYSTQTVIQPIVSTTTSTSSGQSTTSGTEVATLVYSPPGVIYSFAKLGFYFTVNNGGFVNNTAYFEVLNDATFTNKKSASDTETSKVTSIGLALQKNVTVSASTGVLEQQCHATAKTYQEHQSCYWRWGGWAITNSVDENMQGTLFSVLGNVYGAKSTFFGTNHNVMADMSSSAIYKYIADNSYSIFSDAAWSQSNEWKSWTEDKSGTLSADGTQIIFKVNTEVYASDGEHLDTYTRTESVNVKDLLTKIFAQLKEALVNAINAFLAWFK